jgi:hypothetical protein
MTSCACVSDGNSRNGSNVRACLNIELSPHAMLRGKIIRPRPLAGVYYAMRRMKRYRCGWS